MKRKKSKTPKDITKSWGRKQLKKKSDEHVLFSLSLFLSFVF